MPAKSKQQQKFMGIVRAIQKGEEPAGKFSKAAQKAAKSMKKSSVRKYAKTKHDDLPKKVKEEKKRDYKAEYKKFQSSTKAKKYRAELNKYNRKKGTYGNGDGKDASHKGGKIVGFESQSKNRGRAEKSRLKKESVDEGRPKYGKLKLTKDKPKKITQRIWSAPKRIMTKSAYLRMPDINKKRRDGVDYVATSIGPNRTQVYLPVIFESVNEAVSPKGWNMSKKYITFIAREVKNLAKYHRQQNEEDFLEVANYIELQIKQMKKNLNESMDENAQVAMYTQEFDKLLKKQTKGKQPTIKDFDKVFGLMRKRYKELDSKKFEVVKEIKDSDLISKLRSIVKDRQNKIIKDPKSGRKMRVDGYTANAIIKVYDALNNQNKKKFANVGLMKMQSIAFKFVR